MKQIVLFFLTFTCLIQLTAQTGNVGIGTNSPDEKLHVAGGDVKVDNLATGSTKMLVADAAGVIGTQAIPSNADGVVTNVGLSGNTLNFTGTSGGFNGTVNLSSLTDTDWLKTDDTQATSLSNDIYTNGKVGIGINNPSHHLHVVGGAKITNLTGSGTRMVTANSSGVLGTKSFPTLSFSTSQDQNRISISDGNNIDITTQHNVILDTDDSDTKPNITTLDNGYAGEAVKTYTRGALTATGSTHIHTTAKMGILELYIRTKDNDQFTITLYINVDHGQDWLLEYPNMPAGSSYTLSEYPSDPHSGVIIDFNNARVPATSLDKITVHLSGGNINLIGSTSNGSNQDYYALTNIREFYTTPF